MSPVPLSIDVVTTTETIDQSVSEASAKMVDSLEEKNGPSRGVVEGRCNNSEVLANLACYLSHLCEPEKTDITELVSSFPSLFSDVPTQTHVIEHDIDKTTSISSKSSKSS